MGTGSVVIQKIHALLLWLNVFFEYSLIFRGCVAIKNASRTSRLLAAFLDTDGRNYWGGSLIMRFLGAVAGAVFAAAGWAVRVFCAANENSINKKVFDFLVKPRGEDGTGFWGFIAKTIHGCAPVRFAKWFFCEDAGNGAGDSAGNGTAIISLASIFNPKIWYMLFVLGALTVPSFLWNNMLLLASAVFFAGVFALKWVLENDRKKLSFEMISPALVLFVFFCALSIFTGYGGGDSVRVFVIFFACVVHSVIAAIVLKDKKYLQIFFLLAAVALVITALFGFFQLFAGIEIREELTDLGVSPGMSRLYSTMGNPNNDAQAWAMLLPFVLAMAITVKNDTKRLILFGAIALVVGAFALTYSRSGYVALMAGVGVFVLMSAPRLVPIGLIALVFALPFIPSAILERLFTLGQDTSSQYRFLIWEGVRRMLEDFWVQGIGMGPAAFVRIYRSYAHPLAERALHSHNTFFDILVHSGIGALLAFLAYLFRLFKRGISDHVAIADREQKIYIAAGIAALTVFVVFGVGEYVWFHPRVMLVFWVVAGIVSVRRTSDL
ncbi:MAG: O-antigen ligase family protein [Defluviitaleaceae bacterium]|nr:O-antigen ligase family protein [Defluviitaleaceae bacterium]MCL2261818.1 O-antigen ligase family protein [Defluviitaleaceae bacterium]